MGKYKGRREQETAMWLQVAMHVDTPNCQGSVFVVLLLLPWNGWLVVLQNTAGIPTQEHVLPSVAHLWLMVSLAQWVCLASSLLRE